MRTAILLTALVLVCPLAHAVTIFQTAPEPATFILSGGAIVGSSEWMGVDFTIGQPTYITDLGGAFDYNNNKPLFAAILGAPLPSQNFAWYRNNIASIALGSTTFTVPSVGGGGNVDSFLSSPLLLDKGTYTMVIGSGSGSTPILGAAGGAASLNTCCTSDPGNEHLIKGNFNPLPWLPNPNAYLFVNGYAAPAVPEPSSLAITSGLLALLGAGLRRKRRQNAKSDKRIK